MSSRTRVEKLNRGPRRPAKDRAALVQGFLAKANFGLSTMRNLIRRRPVDGKLRRRCGWPPARGVPSEAALAVGSPPVRLHEALAGRTQGEHLVGRIERDSTATQARERPAPKPARAQKPKRKRGRPSKGEEHPQKASRLETLLDRVPCEMLDDLPQACGVGLQAQRQGMCIFLDWLQAALECCQRRRPGELYPEGCAAAQPPGCHPSGDDDSALKGARRALSGQASFRPDGLRTRQVGMALPRRNESVCPYDRLHRNGRGIRSPICRQTCSPARCRWRLELPQGVRGRSDARAAGRA